MNRTATATAAHTDHAAHLITRHVAWSILPTSPMGGGGKGKDSKAYRLAALELQGYVCGWCLESLDADTAESDRLLTGADLGRCEGKEQCQPDCRCAYFAGNVVAAHAGCHRSDDETRPVRYALTDDEVADRLARLPDPTAVLNRKRRIRADDEARIRRERKARTAR